MSITESDYAGTEADHMFCVCVLCANTGAAAPIHCEEQNSCLLQGLMHVLHK